jgi:hypothetical protein
VQCFNFKQYNSKFGWHLQLFKMARTSRYWFLVLMWILMYYALLGPIFWKRYLPWWCQSPDSKPRNYLKCGYYSRGNPVFWFFYFCPHTFFFWHFFTKLEFTSLRDPIPGIHSMGKGGLILEGAHTNKKNRGQIFPLWSVLHSRQLQTLESGCQNNTMVKYSKQI